MKYPGSLHGHSDYSNLRLRDCIIKIPDMIDYALELGHTTIALTDHESISGAIKAQAYYRKVKEKNPDFKLILGNEIYLVRNDLTKDTYKSGKDKFWHFILLAKDARGHEQIREISTRAWARSWKQGKMRRVPTYYQDLIDIIDEDKGHVIASTACLGSYPACLARENRFEELEYWLLQMKQLFGEDNFYLEMQPPAKKDNEQDIYNHILVSLSSKLNIPYIVTTDSHYLRKSDAPIHKAYLNSQDGEREVDEFYATTYMMSTEELEEYFAHCKDEVILQVAYKNIQTIADRCEDYDLRRPLNIPRLPWKTFSPKSRVEDWYSRIPRLKIFYESDYEGDVQLSLAIVERLEKEDKLQDDKTYSAIDRCLDMTWESSIVNKTHWSAYFLNLQKVVQTCWDAGSLVGCGRGSGVGFILLYLLDITQINPLWETTATFEWRFLNPSRVSVLDVDVDIEGGRRDVVLNKLREVYGEGRVSNVATFGTEGSKSAILTAARGLDIDVDQAQYIASLIPADRGKVRTLKQCYYGDDEYKPITSFVREMNSNQELWEVAQKIEGCICRLGCHAGGVIFVDEPFMKSTALMKTPDGVTITAYELHDCEDCSLIKLDLLSVEALDKIHMCLDLLVEDGLIEKKETLKEIYESTIGIYKLEREAPDMWRMIWEHKIQSLFQMEKQSGVQGIALIKPKNVNDLAVLNSVIRLMSSEKGSEQPLNMWARYRRNITQWYQEMKKYGLSSEEIDWLSQHSAVTDGICESQEGLMSLVQEERLGGNSLSFADKCRKALAKKIGTLFDECEKEFFKKVKENHCSQKLADYVWNILLRVQRGYSFNRSHCLAYSLIALQEMNLAYRYPIIYWNTANLIIDSGSNEEDKNTDYTKVAIAVNKIREAGINVSLIDINKSSLSFRPDVEKNKILFGLKGLANVNDSFIQTIEENRPYVSLVDFYYRVKPNKREMISLIKAGAFDEFCGRQDAMIQYLWLTCDKKSRITLQNMPGLMRYNLLPREEKYIFARRVYEFNRYLKDNCKYNSNTYRLDSRAIDFLNSIDREELYDNNFLMDTKTWDKAYKSYMDIFRNWMKKDQEKILENLNTAIFMEDWNKYAIGNISSWEMEALCFYYHDHELKNVDNFRYNLVDYFSLPEEPIVEKVFKKGKSEIPIYKLYCIAGTVIAKNKDKAIAYVLTTTGVVTVKFRKEYFSLFDSQISKRNNDGSKTVIERSWFNKGNKLIIQGIRRGSEFVAKSYKSSNRHTLYHIDEVTKNGSLALRSERAKGEVDEEEI